LLGGRGGPLDNFVGEVTRYVVGKAPTRVILTAPPADAPVAASPPVTTDTADTADRKQ
jgi:APA family basic amino acid/polyamine antiporter